MSSFDAYLYGMTLMTTSILLDGDFPEADGYSEIRSKHRFPGGETGCCANVLASLGLSVLLDGNQQGGQAFSDLKAFFRSKTVDTKRLVNVPDFEGVEDIVIIGGSTRNCFGTFVRYYAREKSLWNVPQEEDIREARVAGIDPYFREESLLAAKLCDKYHVPYVTIDCREDLEIHRLSSVNVVSSEFLRSEYPGADYEELLSRFAAASEGLTIFTFGAREILFARKGGEIRRMKPFSVRVESTLGAGDCFKAGAVYALSRGMKDEDLVRFAAATSGAAISRYPIAENPPTLERIYAILN